jgi:hypothetical protein
MPRMTRQGTESIKPGASDSTRIILNTRRSSSHTSAIPDHRVSRPNRTFRETLDSCCDGCIYQQRVIDSVYDNSLRHGADSRFRIVDRFQSLDTSILHIGCVCDIAESSSGAWEP